MKYLLTLILALGVLTSNAQSWQKTFLSSGTPVGIEAQSNGQLFINYHNQVDQTWSRLILDVNGQIVGTEIFSPPVRGYHIFSLNELSYYSLDSTLIWKRIANAPQNSSVRSTNSGIGILFWNDPNTLNSVSQIWVYDVTGELIFNQVADGPFSMNGWIVNSKTDGSLLLKKRSSTGPLPQGASVSRYEYFLFDKEGIQRCMDTGILRTWDPSRIVSDLAFNEEMICGAAGYLRSGVIDPSLPDGQFLPCTEELLLPENEIPLRIELIGLQGDAYAILGENFAKDSVIVTRMDCNAPFQSDQCVDQIVVLTEEICEGDSFSFSDTTITTTGDYVFPFLSFQGCDSIVHLEILVSENTIAIDPEMGGEDGNAFINLNSNCMECTYQWSNGGVVDIIAGLDFGTYSVTITAPSGCQLIDTFQVELSSNSNLTLLKNQVRLLPNLCHPGESLQILKFDHRPQNLVMSIYNSAGIRLSDLQLNNFGSSTSAIYAPSDSGLYFVEFKNDSNQIIAIERLVVL